MLAYAKENPGSGLEGVHWSSTQRSADCAFYVYFSGGGQYHGGKDDELRVRPVRRVLIQ